ncbi:MAG TPA: polyhydroxyalkanoic acid system family protein [Allosphingosinicella sp.]|nr:polyhydroxyalkanoic acid system family protein [Allosphingosinicella sp.]
MTKPLVVDLPHTLGVEEAKRRMQGSMGKLKDHIPGGTADVSAEWNGDRMHLIVNAMGQEVSANIDVMETVVRVEVMLPGMLSFFGSQIQGYLQSVGGQLLEDKSKPNSKS